MISEDYKFIFDILLSIAITFFTGMSWYFNKKSETANSRPILILKHRIIEESETSYEDYEIENLGQGPALNIKIAVKLRASKEENTFPYQFHLRNSESKQDLFRCEYDKNNSIFDNTYIIEYNDLFNNLYQTIAIGNDNKFLKKRIGKIK